MAADKKNRFVGENSLDRMVRLLKEFNEKSIKGQQYVDVIIEATGAGRLVIMTENSDPTTLYDFGSLLELLHFLQMSSIDQMLEIRGNL